MSLFSAKVVAFEFHLLGQPVDDPSDVGYVPTIFAYESKVSAATQKQKEERAKRLDKKGKYIYGNTLW